MIRICPVTHQEQIIVVEDDSSMTNAIERLLRVSGFGARSFTSAESLLRSGAAPEAACFVFDIHLPGLSGLELYQRLVENGVKRPVIFITAHDEPSLWSSAEQFGAATCLLKPFPGRTLLDAVRRANEEYPRDGLIKEQAIRNENSNSAQLSTGKANQTYNRKENT